ncbi:uncharacterized protein SOCEGT47_040340 [Sorangium cellulosum]|uniref:Uncharacterized protein n=1 Tax=Sorangium cellulosum TaxID=56 RepID=A0A4P2Q2H4_SORCE|nr:uncharacterized protein SOCEGT47_040340 [Sorangium cellulosum]
MALLARDVFRPALGEARLEGAARPRPRRGVSSLPARARAATGGMALRGGTG